MEDGSTVLDETRVLKSRASKVCWDGSKFKLRIGGPIGVIERKVAVVELLEIVAEVVVTVVVVEFRTLFEDEDPIGIGKAAGKLLLCCFEGD